jgi:hypothetical protein
MNALFGLRCFFLKKCPACCKHLCRKDSQLAFYKKNGEKPFSVSGPGQKAHQRWSQRELEPTASVHQLHTTYRQQETDLRLQVTRLQSAVIPHFDGIGVRVAQGSLKMGSGLAFGIVHKYEAIFLIKTKLVRPAPGVIGATVSAPGGCGSAGGCPRSVAGAAGLAGSILRNLADALLLCFRITAVFILGFLPWVKQQN